MYYGRLSVGGLKCIMVAYLTTTYMYYGRPSDGSLKCIMAAYLTAA